MAAYVPDEPTMDELMEASDAYPKAITDRYLQLPPDFPASIRELAMSLTEDYSNSYAKALAIKEYLSTIEYSLEIEAPPPDTDGIEYFLFTQQAGYCVYFASAMAVMMRSIDVPARVVIGYLPGQYDPEKKRFIIRERDYHAWMEVYFPGHGWVLFDPTPGSQNPYLAGDSEFTDWNYWNELYQTAGLSEEPSHVSDYAVNLKLYASYIGGSAGILIFLGLFFGWLLLYRRPRNNALLYSRMVTLATLSGIGPARTQTPFEYAKKLANTIPRHAQDISNITSTYVELRYGNRDGRLPNWDSKSSWKRLRHTLIRRVLHI